MARIYREDWTDRKNSKKWQRWGWGRVVDVKAALLHHPAARESDG